MRHLILCADGTWNTPDQDADGVPVPTNVVRLFNSVAEQSAGGIKQLAYYHPGVGTDGTWWEKAKGGSVGDGLNKNILSAWGWLCRKYEVGDRIFLFGFSRGAYTVRSLSGLLGACGLPDIRNLPESEQWKRLDLAFTKGYRERQLPATWATGLSFLRSPEDVRIDFLGVWDTVGALGIPDNLAILNLLDNHKRYAFHDTTLSAKVLHARHAVGLDEARASFAPTLWTNKEAHADLRQLWFPGVHCDVGGGYRETGLSDGALLWMIEEASAQGLAFKPRMLKQIHPDHQDTQHDSCNGLFKLLRTQPRAIPELTAANKDTLLHASSLQRLEDPPINQAPYRKFRTLKPGEEALVEIFAAERWNETGLWLETGSAYRFHAEGQWLDRDISCGPKGSKDGHFEKGELIHVASGIWGKFEQMVKKVTGNEEADFWGTRREEKSPWMALIGTIANGGNPTPDGTPAPHETFCIGDKLERRPMKSGYLFCFANDAWNFYRNNRGRVYLTVGRLPD